VVDVEEALIMDILQNLLGHLVDVEEEHQDIVMVDLEEVALENLVKEKVAVVAVLSIILVVAVAPMVKEPILQANQMVEMVF
jgi:hypothetical protein